MQMSVFYLLPSLLLSGFMFPFRGMPDWAQAIGSVIPVTHFLRIVRGALLKGVGLADTWPSVLALAAFVLVVGRSAWRAIARRWTDAEPPGRCSCGRCKVGLLPQFAEPVHKSCSVWPT
jgi:ABC-type multidrug transport system permease subunit